MFSHSFSIVVQYTISYKCSIGFTHAGIPFDGSPPIAMNGCTLRVDSYLEGLSGLKMNPDFK